MIFNLYQNPFISPKRLDRFLAHGWFRNCNMLGKQQVICLETGLHSIINIRVTLNNYKFPKSLAKNYKNNSKKFRFEIHEVQLNSEKEQLYHAHKHRFEGAVLPTLELSLFGFEGAIANPFHTQELCVYDGMRLVAVSYFDIGYNSVASIMGLFDHDYQKDSLGMFSMLVEIDLAMRLGKQFYYPGYILHQNPNFDYKLRLGNIQYHDGKNYWLPFSDFPKAKWLDTQIADKTKNIMKILAKNAINSHSLINPYFPLAYLFTNEIPFLLSPIQIKLDVSLDIALNTSSSNSLIIEYIPDTKHYRLSYAQKAILTEEIQELLSFLGNYNPEIYLQDIHVYEEIILESYEIEDIVEMVLLEKIQV